MKINIPDNFLPERTYIIDIIVGEFLGLEYKTETYGGADYRITLDNGNTLVIADHFFSAYNENEFKYDVQKLPAKIIFVKNEFLPENDIPVIFGVGRLEVSDDKILCGIDIFASAFFMLTRWEEYTIDVRDEHGRFSAYDSAALKSGFLNRPIVNEYASLLANLLRRLKHGAPVKIRNFKVIPTHDVDQPLWSARSIVKRTIKDFVSKKNFGIMADNAKLHFRSKKNPRFDPYNNFGYLMDQSEKNNLTSHFFFQSARKCKFDTGYDIRKKFFGSLFEEITARGHIIGFHPGYHTYTDEKKWKEEYESLAAVTGIPLNCGRQHYLRFDVPETWQIWDNNGMNWESSMTYHDKEGFRAGTCYEFSVFNILTRKKIKLKEKPLIVMEGSFFQYQNLDRWNIIDKILELKNIVKKYNGEFVFLWHNSSFNVAGYEDNKEIYEAILK